MSIAIAAHVSTLVAFSTMIGAIPLACIVITHSACVGANPFAMPYVRSCDKQSVRERASFERHREACCGRSPSRDDFEACRCGVALQGLSGLRSTLIRHGSVAARLAWPGHFTRSGLMRAPVAQPGAPGGWRSDAPDPRETGRSLPLRRLLWLMARCERTWAVHRPR